MGKRKFQDNGNISKKQNPSFCCTIEKESGICNDMDCYCTNECQSPSLTQGSTKRRPTTVDRACDDTAINALILAASGDRNALAKQLSDRARTCFEEGRVAKAFENALTIIRAIPALPTGYAVAGRFLSVLERRVDAIDMYCRGLCQVPLCEPGYEELVVALAEHMTRLRKAKAKRIGDPLATLPMDLLVAIGQLLTLEERIAWTRVSSAWREGLFQCATLWTCFAMDNADPRWDIFSAICVHIKDLTIGAFQRVPAIRLFNKMDMKATFKHLQSLRILGCLAPRELICIALCHMQQLTAFSITSPNVSIVDILSSCPTLKALTFVEPSNTPKVELYWRADLPYHLALESLTIVYPKVREILLFAAVLRRRCHALRNFFSNCDISDLLDERRCIDLKQLYVLACLPGGSMQITIRESCRDSEDDVSTENELSYYTKEFEQHLEDLYQAYPAVRSDTQSLVCEQQCCTQNAKALVIADTIFKTLEFDNLLNMDYTAPFAEEHRHFAAFIRRHPRLHSLRSVNGNIFTDCSVSASLSAAACLEKLVINEAHIDGDVFTSYIRHQESLDAKSTLQYLVLSGVHGVNDAIIQSIAALPYLRSFTLKPENALFTTRGLRNFAETLACSYRLERLVLFNITNLDDDIMAKLAYVRPLVSLIIVHADALLTAEGVRRLAANSRSLSTVTLTGCPGVSGQAFSEITTLFNVDVFVRN